MARDIAKVLMKIEDETMWDQVMEASMTKLVMMDCHQEWCGMCDSMHPTMNRVLLDYDEIDERFLYAAASIGKVGDKIQSSLPQDLNIDLEKNGCLPLFAFYRVGTLQN